MAYLLVIHDGSEFQVSVHEYEDEAEELIEENNADDFIGPIQISHDLNFLLTQNPDATQSLCDLVGDLLRAEHGV